MLPTLRLRSTNRPVVFVLLVILHYEANLFAVATKNSVVGSGVDDTPTVKIGACIDASHRVVAAVT